MKAITKSRAEINKTENRKKKIMKLNVGFLKDQQNWETLRLKKEIRSIRRTISTNATEIKWILRDYYEK